MAQAQPKQIHVSGSDCVIYTDRGLAFQSGTGSQIMEIEVLTGTWSGENCRLGINERGGELYFESNVTCEFQLTNYDASRIRLTYEGFGLTPINMGFSFNGTFPAGETPCLLHWSWALDLPHEENWALIMGLIGLVLLIIGLFLMAYLIRTYPIFSFSREILFDKLSFAVAIAMIIIGIGFIMMWLMS